MNNIYTNEKKYHNVVSKFVNENHRKKTLYSPL